MTKDRVRYTEWSCVRCVRTWLTCAWSSNGSGVWVLCEGTKGVELSPPLSCPSCGSIIQIPKRGSSRG